MAMALLAHHLEIRGMDARVHSAGTLGWGGPATGHAVETLAARGIDLGVGTAAEILDSTDFFAQQDVNTTRFNASREAWSARAGGELERYRGRMAARNANMQAAGTLLGTGGQVASKWKT